VRPRHQISKEFLTARKVLISGSITHETLLAGDDTLVASTVIFFLPDASAVE
jgi:hypothetical protein